MDRGVEIVGVYDLYAVAVYNFDGWYLCQEKNPSVAYQITV